MSYYDVCEKMDKIFAKTEKIYQEDIEKHFQKTFKRLGSGAYRTSMLLNENWIIKIPRGHYSMNQNIVEYLITKQHQQYFPYTFLYNFHGVPVLVAEVVEKRQDPRKIFGSDVIDDGYYQSGMTKSKRFVCYDAGNESDLVNIDAGLVDIVLQTAPELPQYDDLIAQVDKEWAEAKKWVQRIPYTKLVPFGDYLKTVK